MVEDVDERLRQQSSEVVEALRHLLSRQQSPRRLNVSSCRLHGLPSTAELHEVDGAGAEEVACCSTVAEGVRHVRGVLQAVDGTGLVHEVTETRRGEVEHQRVSLRSSSVLHPLAQHLSHVDVEEWHRLICSSLGVLEYDRHVAVR